MRLIGLFVAVVMCMAIGAPSAGATAAPRAEAVTLSKSQRASLFNELSERWSDTVARRGGSAVEWRQKLSRLVQSADTRNLILAVEMPSYETAMGALQGQRLDSESMGRALLAAEQAPGKVFGSTMSDLVFTPLANGRCRVADSRTIALPLAPALSRLINVEDVASYAQQGGSGAATGQGSANCGLPDNATAYMASVTVIPVGQDGFFKIFRADKPFSDGNTILFTGLAGAANDVVVPSCDACFAELAVYSNVSVHVVIDIIGYFMPPQATALQCTDVESGGLVLNVGGAASVYSPSCPAGYTMSGGGCTGGNLDTKIVTSRPTGTEQYCTFRFDGTTGSTTVKAHARCCRVPGR